MVTTTVVYYKLRMASPKVVVIALKVVRFCFIPRVLYNMQYYKLFLQSE